MKDIIIPTTEFKEEEEKVYKLEDKDYLLIKAIQDLTFTIDKLRVSLNG